MYDTAVVRVLERLKYLNSEVNRVAPFQHALLFDVISKRDTVNVFHNDELHLIGESHVVDLYDIRVGKQRYRLGFITESAQEFIAAGELRLEYLYRNNAVLYDVAGLVYIRHSPDADKLKQLVSAVKLFSDVTVHKCSAISPYIINKGCAVWKRRPETDSI